MKFLDSTLPKMGIAFSDKQRRYAITIRKRAWLQVRDFLNQILRDQENGSYEDFDGEIGNPLALGMDALQAIHAEKDPLFWIGAQEKLTIQFLAEEFKKSPKSKIAKIAKNANFSTSKSGNLPKKGHLSIG